ncbi:Sulfurtransferase TusA [uncultured archaeon]|nr:Sulfurtransferase TusA [uncultured archaeon]
MTEELDLRGEVCPYTFVRTKLKLEEMESGEDLIVLLDDAAATANVSKSLRNEGHQIDGIKSIAESVWEIRAKKG